VIGRISITASMTRLTRRLPKDVRALFSDIRTLKGTYTMQTVWSRLRLWSASDLAEVKAAVDPLAVAKPGSGISKKWAARFSRPMARLDVIGSLVLAGAIEGGFSLYEDMQMRDIYGLTDQQMVGRTFVRGVGAGVSTGVVMGLGWLILGEVCPPLWFAVPVFLCAEALWERGIAPIWYQHMGLYGSYEPRQPLGTLDLGALQRRRYTF
jgi:hypothetical protein